MEKDHGQQMMLVVQKSGKVENKQWHCRVVMMPYCMIMFGFFIKVSKSLRNEAKHTEQM